MLHISLRSRSGSSASRPVSAVVELPPAIDRQLELVADEVGAPRRVVWPASLRALAGELQMAQDALDPDAEGSAWVVPL